MFGQLISEKILPIFQIDRGWVVRIYKKGSLFSVQCSEGNLTLEEKEAIYNIIFDPSFIIKLQSFIDNLEDGQQTKKDSGIQPGIFCNMGGIKNQNVAEQLVSLLEQEIAFKAEYIKQNS